MNMVFRLILVRTKNKSFKGLLLSFSVFYATFIRLIYDIYFPSKMVAFSA